MRYLVIGGIPFTGYTGTETYTDLTIRGGAPTVEAAQTIFDAFYDESGGLLIIVDTATGEEVSRDVMVDDEAGETEDHTGCAVCHGH